MLSLTTWGQSDTSRNSTAQHQKTKKEKTHTAPSPGRQVANGTGNVAGGAGKGAGDLAKGGAKGAGDLVTLHPIDAGVSVGKGAAGAGKDVAVGTTKGTAKITKGIGRAIKHLF
jgi:hypothetical protein